MSAVGECRHKYFTQHNGDQILIKFALEISLGSTLELVLEIEAKNLALKVRQSQNYFLTPTFPPKKQKQTNSHLLL